MLRNFKGLNNLGHVQNGCFSGRGNDRVELGRGLVPLMLSAPLRQEFSVGSLPAGCIPMDGNSSGDSQRVALSLSFGLPGDIVYLQLNRDRG